MSCQNTTSSVHYQPEFHLSRPFPVSTSSLLFSSSQNTMSMPMSSQITTLSAYTHSIHQLTFPCPVSTSPFLPMSQYLLPMSTQNTTSTAHVTSVHHLSFFNQFTISTASMYVQSVHHISCLHSVSTPPYIYGHFQPEYHIPCPCMSRHYTISTAHVQLPYINFLAPNILPLTFKLCHQRSNLTLTHCVSTGVSPNFLH